MERPRAVLVARLTAPILPLEPFACSLKDKTVSYRVPADTDIAEAADRITARVSIDEPDLGIKDEEAFGLLHRYVEKVTDVIALFCHCRPPPQSNTGCRNVQWSLSRTSGMLP